MGAAARQYASVSFSTTSRPTQRKNRLRARSLISIADGAVLLRAADGAAVRVGGVIFAREPDAYRLTLGPSVALVAYKPDVASMWKETRTASTSFHRAMVVIRGDTMQTYCYCRAVDLAEADEVKAETVGG